MRRRELIAALCGAAVAQPPAARSQPARIARVGIVSMGGSSQEDLFAPFFAGMRELGYQDQRTVAYQRASAGGNRERLDELVAAMMLTPPDVVIATSTFEVMTVQRAGGNIPIVVVLVPDPVAAGLAASLARPGGTITGFSVSGPEMHAKRLELLRDALPGLARVAILVLPGSPTGDPTMPWATDLRAAARTLGVEISFVPANSADDLAPAFAAMTAWGAGAVMVMLTGLFSALRERIAALALASRLPSMFELRESATAGGLFVYGANMGEVLRRAASFVDRILKGARPADLPIEQPTRFELIVNLRTARALGITLPPGVLARADEVIE
jgi:putative ABC transport system substrate-binding protein